MVAVKVAARVVARVVVKAAAKALDKALDKALHKALDKALDKAAVREAVKGEAKAKVKAAPQHLPAAALHQSPPTAATQLLPARKLLQHLLCQAINQGEILCSRSRTTAMLSFELGFFSDGSVCWTCSTLNGCNISMYTCRYTSGVYGR